MKRRLCRGAWAVIASVGVLAVLACAVSALPGCGKRNAAMDAAPPPRDGAVPEGNYASRKRLPGPNSATGTASGK